LENEILREALDLVQPKNGCCAGPRRCRTTRREDDRRYARGRPLEPGHPGKRCDPCSLARPAKPETELVVEIKQIIASQPTYGYRRVHVLIGRWRHEEGGAAVNRQTRLPDHESHGLLLERHTGTGGERRHDGRVPVAKCVETFVQL